VLTILYYKSVTLTLNTLDITEGNRQNLTDARDPGGRLGPYIEANPDLRNLHLYFHLAEPDDIIFLMSGMMTIPNPNDQVVITL
jgi:hypothetical protein